MQPLSKTASPAVRSAAKITPSHSSWLVTPGVRPDRFATAIASGVDVALLDLEDSVPASRKDQARQDVLRFLHHHRSGSSTLVGVRVNALDTLHGLRDLVELAEHGQRPAVLLVPKVESARDIDLVSRIMDGSPAPCQIWALIESPRALRNLNQIVDVAALAGVVFGAADYAAQAGCKITRSALRYPRATLAAAAATAGVPAVDSPFFRLHDPNGLQQEADEAAELGYIGKIALHPNQLPAILDAFLPSQDDLVTARAVIGAADAADGAITTVGGVMVGPPIVAAARAITARAGDSAVVGAYTGVRS